MTEQEVQLDQLQLEDLAELCQKVSQLTDAESYEINTGRALYEEWSTLEMKASSEHEKSRLKRNIVHFLASVLPSYIASLP